MATVRNLISKAFGFTALAVCFPSTVYAQRAETISPAELRVTQASYGAKGEVLAPTCPLTLEGNLDLDRARSTEFLGGLLTTLFAGFAGDLVKSGVTTLGNALDEASKERGFVAEADAGFFSGTIEKQQIEISSNDDGVEFPDFTWRQAVFQPRAKCLVLFVPSDPPKSRGRNSGGSVTSGDFVESLVQLSPFQLQGGAAFQDPESDGSRNEILRITNRVKNLGIERSPKLYIEAVLFQEPEGLVIRPYLLWYREALSGAPRRGKKSTELHVTLATPAFDAEKPTIGTAFAGARIQLPQMEPGPPLGPRDLANSASVWLPPRPTAGTVQSTVERYNTEILAVRTREAERLQAATELAEAQRATGADAEAKKRAAIEKLLETEKALAVARKIDADMTPGGKAIGATNVQMRFVVVRSASKFGQAIASAIKGQAEAAGTGVKEALAPSPEFTANDTAYLTAMLDVEAKGRALTAATAGDDADAINAANDALRIAKAKANEAAVAVSKPLPYPGVLTGF
ncbi:hypothetical protein [Novosphingobium profundi]|uniref:hypothetical protein n=1 Tax=Novosphingobium profundi TaxID=1774954 RepID=UPI001CFCDB2B|nr:hypothetical protein [Novosphingobium profundi]